MTAQEMKDLRNSLLVKIYEKAEGQLGVLVASSDFSEGIDAEEGLILNAVVHMKHQGLIETLTVDGSPSLSSHGIEEAERLIIENESIGGGAGNYRKEKTDRMKILSEDKPRVFIVHGHDMATLNRLELLLHRIGVEPVTLRKAPKAGSMTLIELLEEYLPEADAVVVLMTPDDEGRSVGSGDPLEPRVRENVLVEAGYAVINNRKRSLLIAIGGVSIPSDFSGIARIQEKTWGKILEPDLAKRLRDMGLLVNLDGAI